MFGLPVPTQEPYNFLEAQLVIHLSVFTPGVDVRTEAQREYVVDPRWQTEGMSCGLEGMSCVRWAGTHSALEGIDLTGVGLDLVSVLHHLLLGLAQCVIVLVCCLGQVRHLKAQRDPEMMQVGVDKGAWSPWITLLPQNTPPN